MSVDLYDLILYYGIYITKEDDAIVFLNIILDDLQAESSETKICDISDQNHDNIYPNYNCFGLGVLIVERDIFTNHHKIIKERCSDFPQCLIIFPKPEIGATYTKIT